LRHSGKGCSLKFQLTTDIVFEPIPWELVCGLPLEFGKPTGKLTNQLGVELALTAGGGNLQGSPGGDCGG